jgi:RNA polymerase sigma factor (sigma-70 family)
MVEAEILSNLRQDRNSAFRSLYSSYFPMIKWFIEKNSGSEEDAHDIFQDALIIIYEKSCQDQFEWKSSIKTYLYSICRNLWLKRLRQNKNVNYVEDFESFEPVENTELTEEKPNLLEQMKQSMEQLGEKCRRIILAFYYEKKKMDEIAVELSYTNAENAKNQKYKCLQQLKKNMKGGADE